MGMYTMYIHVIQDFIFFFMYKKIYWWYFPTFTIDYLQPFIETIKLNKKQANTSVFLF